MTLLILCSVLVKIISSLLTGMIFKNLQNIPKGDFQSDFVVPGALGGTVASNLIVKDYMKRFDELLPLAQFKKPKKHPLRSAIFSKTEPCNFIKSNNPPWVFFHVFLIVPNCAKHHIYQKNSCPRAFFNSKETLMILDSAQSYLTD